MTAKTYLSQLYRLEQKIKARSEQIEELKTIASGFKGMDYTADRVQTSPKDRMAEKVGKYADMEKDLYKLIDHYISLKDEIIWKIYAIEDNRYTTILYKHYVEFKSLAVVAKEMSYDYKYACRIHGYALAQFEKIDDKSRH